MVKAYRLIISCLYHDSIDGTTEGEVPEVRRSIPSGTIIEDVKTETDGGGAILSFWDFAPWMARRNFGYAGLLIRSGRSGRSGARNE